MTSTAARPPAVIGLDLGGTYLKSVVIDDDGGVRHRHVSLSRAAGGAGGALETIVAEAERLIGEEGTKPRALGLGLPGAVDREHGRPAAPTPHLPGAEGIEPRAALERRFGIPVLVDNDANAATRAEARLGAARGVGSAVMIVVGTGVGCGMLVDGRVIEGATGGAGEIGHWPIGTGEIACRCGVPRCAEPEMGAGGLALTCDRRGLPWREWEEVLAAAAGGDARALDLERAMADRLGATIAMAVHLLDPEAVILGGGVASLERFPIDDVRQATRGYLQRGRGEGPRILRAELGLYAGAVGAALLAGDGRPVVPAGRASRPS